VLRATAITTAALAVVSVTGTSYAAVPGSFGSPTRTHAHGRFGTTVTGGAYNGTQAIAQLTAIATATRAASAGGALVTGSAFSDNVTSQLTIKVDGTSATQVQIGGPLSLTMIATPTKQYVRLDLTDPDVNDSLQHLGVTGAHYVGQASTDPLNTPADIIEQLYTDGAPAISGMKRTEHAGLISYQVTSSVPVQLRGLYPDTATVTTDRANRVVAFRSAANDQTVNGEQYVVRYGPQSVAIPASQDVVDATQFGKALASTHLPEALAFVAEEGFFAGYPSSGSETVAQFRTGVRSAATDPDNGMSGIAVTVADVAGGVTLTATNPFTHANVTVRAVLNGYGWVSITDSAGRPVEPDGITVSTSLQLRRTAAQTLGISR
jgi:hypothetical protein